MIMHKALYKYDKISLCMVVVVIVIAFGLIITSCAGNDPAQDDWGQRYISDMYEFSFAYPQEMEIKTEKVRNGAVTIHLEQTSGKAMQLVFYMVPDALGEEELASEAQMLLSSSLYRTQSITERDTEGIAGHQGTLIEVVAGEKDIIRAGAAAFSSRGRSFFITIIAPEENYEPALDNLYRVVESVD